jgi:hypothetical protein
MTYNKLKFVWKHRRPLWKYRKLVRHRREIAVATGAGLVLLAAGILVRRNCIEHVNVQ